jgi:putative hemolysin
MGSERLLTEFRTRHATMAIVVDEYGGAAGIVTPADVVAAVMGDLDEDDEADVVALPGGAYDVDGIAPLEEIGETLKITFDTPNVRTVAGFLMERLGRMPRLGDRVGLGKYNFYIMDIEGPRVRRVRIQVEPSRELPPNLRAVHARPPEGATPVPPEGAKAAPDAEPKLPDAPPKL